ncbi:hypothetical protein GCM10011415_02340 [Salipiger pallidus]|uniref:Uncharacterized protein n=1 Tax=Salipiger pallidus TaxID=1775170 RepID=A0A8J2ZGI1_9RHOB|nr:hypothetical protein [Salipiger pallidus]GGG59891.1 hypothetical protein GCM10011415_02340 [Salipiger pallidus]
MAKATAPSMPTPRQIQDAFEAVRALHPGARIVSVGPDGVKFDYADGTAAPGQATTTDKRAPIAWT